MYSSFGKVAVFIAHLGRLLYVLPIWEGCCMYSPFGKVAVCIVHLGRLLYV
jgi:hypothetical protein